MFFNVSAGLEGVRFLNNAAAGQNAAALQTMVNQQNALRSIAAASAAQPATALGGAPLILANAAAAAAAAQARGFPPTTQASLLANGQVALAVSAAQTGRNRIQLTASFFK